jgi:tetratricopeptide (TPR) repeat protein
VAFFKNLFGGKDARSILDKGNRLLAEERYAEARGCYSDALERLGADDGSLRDEITTGLREAGDALAEVNLEEAERYLIDGDALKALDHLELAREFAVAPEVSLRVDGLSRRLAATATNPHSPDSPEKDASCTSCAGGSCNPEETLFEPPSAASDGHLSPEERFELMTAALPEDLPRRYRAMGARFAEAYLLAHDGDDDSAAGILESITIPASQDIIFYERAVIRHRQGDARECETLLRQAYRANERNPLCCLALVDLYVGTDRPEVALALLDTMIAMELLPAQALMTKGDIQEHLGLDGQALDSYAILLESPYKKDAATKIIPILEKLGRSDEARQLFTQYVKGCC